MKLKLLALSLLAGTSSAGDVYKLEGVKRIDQDMYRSGNLIIQTRYCYHYTYGEEAILKYEGPGEFSGSKIIWDDNSSCDVKKLLKI